MTSNRITSIGCKRTDDDLIYLTLCKGIERYVFAYRNGDRRELFKVIDCFASNPELSFTYYDLAVLSQKIRQEAADA